MTSPVSDTLAAPMASTGSASPSRSGPSLARLRQGGLLFGASQALAMGLGFAGTILLTRVAEPRAVASYMLLIQSTITVGLLLQLGLIAIVGYMLWSWWQRRNQPAFAGGPMLRDVSSPQATYGGGSGGNATSASGADSVGLTGSDFDQFERLLGEVQTAYGREDLGALRSRVTPEMLSYLSEELTQNASRGVVNKLSNVKLLQGDLSEAWREGDSEYATVAMRYSLDDRTVDRSTGRLIEGGLDEATEVWTFRRAPGGAWLVSAIQQVD